MFPFLSPYPSLVGLDIDTHEVRLLQMSRRSNRYVIENFAVKSLPSGVMLQGKVHHKEMLCQILAACVEETNTRGSSAVIALPSHVVIKKEIKLPKGLNEKEYEIEITHHLKHYFPGITEELCFDFFKTKGEPSDVEEEALLIATRADNLYSLVDIVQTAGWVVKAVDVKDDALVRIVRFIEPDDPLLIFYSEHTTAHFLVVDYDRRVFSQQSHFNQEEMRRTLQWCTSLCSSVPIKKIIMCGDSKKNDLVQEIFREKYSFDIVSINPFSNMMLSKKITEEHIEANFSKLWIAGGLAMRNVKK